MAYLLHQMIKNNNFELRSTEFCANIVICLTENVLLVFNSVTGFSQNKQSKQTSYWLTG